MDTEFDRDVSRKQKCLRNLDMDGRITLRWNLVCGYEGVGQFNVSHCGTLLKILRTAQPCLPATSKILCCDDCETVTVFSHRLFDVLSTAKVVCECHCSVRFFFFWYSVEQSTSEVASSSSGSQDFRRILCDPTVHYRVHNSPHLTLFTQS
jgi:hypothetical protein